MNNLLKTIGFGAFIFMVLALALMANHEANKRIIQREILKIPQVRLDVWTRKCISVTPPEAGTCIDRPPEYVRVWVF